MTDGEEAYRPQQFSSIIVGLRLQFRPTARRSSFCRRAVEDESARACAVVPLRHVRTIAYHVEGAAKQGVPNPPSVAITFKVVPQLGMRT